jgi:TRAP-type C4-dicarboxylate transport system permease small subunit
LADHRHPLERAFTLVTQTLLAFAGCALALMMLHVTLNAFVSKAFNSPIIGTIEISSYYYMVAIVMLPAGFVELRDGHISVDLLFQHFPEGLRRFCIAFASLVTAAVFLVMAYRTSLDAITAFRVREVIMGGRNIIVWPARCMLPLGFGLAGIAALLRLALIARGTRSDVLTNTGEVAR